MNVLLDTGRRPPADQRGAPARTWSGWAAAAWCAVFAVRGAYWATGGTAGIGTLAADLRRQASERAAPTLIVLWTTVALEVFGVAAAIGLARSTTSPTHAPSGWATTRFALAVVAAVALIGHGLLFSTLAFTAPALTTTEQWWYAAFWGPWFILGGLLFALAAQAERRRRDIRPDTAARAGIVVGLAALTTQVVLAITT